MVESRRRQRNNKGELAKNMVESRRGQRNNKGELAKIRLKVEEDNSVPKIEICHHTKLQLGSEYLNDV